MAVLFAQGTGIKLGTVPIASTPTYTVIDEIISIAGPTMSRDRIDVTAHDSAGQVRKFINGLLDPGELTFSINYDPDNTTHDDVAGLLSVFDSGDIRAYLITFTDPTPTKWEFDAICNGFEINAPVDAQLTADITLSLTGAIDFDSAAS